MTPRISLGIALFAMTLFVAGCGQPHGSRGGGSQGDGGPAAGAPGDVGPGSNPRDRDIGGDDEQNQVDARSSSDHLPNESFVTRHIDDPTPVAVGQIHVREA